MSKFNLIALAVAATLAAPSAFAITVVPTAAQTRVAHVDVVDDATVVAVGAIPVGIADTDLIIGRTVGFSVRIDLQGGAEFASAPATVPVGTALQAGAAWTANLAAGGTAGDTFAVYSVQPAAGSTGVINGPALAFGANSITVQNVAGLGTVGGTVSATVTFADPGTAQPILTPVSAVIVRSANPLAYDVSGGDTASKIDVGTAGAPSKTRFSPTGSIGGATTANRFFDAGAAAVGVVTGTGAVRTVGDALAPFAWAAGDTVALTLAGTFNAFSATTPANGASVTLVTVGSCAAPTTTIPGTVAAGGVTFPAATTFGALGNGILCFTTPNNTTTQIDASSVATSVTVRRTATTKTATASDAALPLAYNGPVVEVDHFNPASNANQISYLRVINPSAAAGLVTISGVCDNGTAQAPVTLTLAAGNAVLLTANDLATGAKGLSGAFTQCATGKSRLTVTGEFNGMKVQNFLRNVTADGGQINTNVNNQN